MADIRAAFSYHLVPDLKPQFSEHGECVHCDYVQPWKTRTNSAGLSAEALIAGPLLRSLCASLIDTRITALRIYVPYQ